MSVHRLACVAVSLTFAVAVLQASQVASAATLCTDEECSVKLPQFFTGSEGTHVLRSDTGSEALYRYRWPDHYSVYHEPLTLIGEDERYWYYRETNSPGWQWTISKCPSYQCASCGRCGRRSYTVCCGYGISLYVNGVHKVSYYARRTGLMHRTAEEAAKEKAAGG